MKRYRHLFCCPGCGGKLNIGGNTRCADCHASFRVRNGIVEMFWPQEKFDAVTAKVKRFYEATPFPDYDGLETAADLVNKAERGNFAAILDKLIPINAKVLEAGCGTGQLANYLGIVQRDVFGTDMSLAPLKLAEEFRRRNRLNRVGFYQMNLFRPIFRPNSFDAVISNGVLHHTPGPGEGFLSLAGLVKPGGTIVIGLYHKWSRWVHHLSHFFGINVQLAKIKDKSRRRAWSNDQYRHPHESTHTVNEVRGWLRSAGMESVVVMPRSVGEFFLTGVREGGLFVVIGRKR